MKKNFLKTFTLISVSLLLFMSLLTGLGSAVTENYVYAGGAGANATIQKYLASDLSYQMSSEGTGSAINTLVVSGDYIYVGLSNGYIKKYLRTDLSLVATSPSTGSSIKDMLVSGSYVYVISGSYTKKYSASNLAYSNEHLTPASRIPYRFSTDGTNLFVLNDVNLLPVVMSTMASGSGGGASSLAGNNALGYSSTYSHVMAFNPGTGLGASYQYLMVGIYSTDLSSMHSLSIPTTSKFTAPVKEIYMDGGYIYFSDSLSYLNRLTDGTTQLTSPISVDTGLTIGGLTKDSTYLYVGGSGGYIKKYNTGLTYQGVSDSAYTSTINGLGTGSEEVPPLNIISFNNTFTSNSLTSFQVIDNQSVNFSVITDLNISSVEYSCGSGAKGTNGSTSTSAYLNCEFNTVGNTVVNITVNSLGGSDTQLWYIDTVPPNENIVSGAIGTFYINGTTFQDSFINLNLLQSFMNVTSAKITINSSTLNESKYDYLDSLNPVGWWKFDDNYLDSSGNENHGTSVGDVYFDQGIYNNASFYESGNHVDIANSSSLALDFPLSFTIVVNGDYHEIDSSGMFAKGESGVLTDWNYGLYTYAGSVYMAFGDGVNIRYVYTDDILQDNNTYFVTGLINNSNDMQIHINSVNMSVTYGGTATTPYKNANMSIGTFADKFFTGWIDNALLFDYLLSPTECLNIYSNYVQELRIKSTTNETWSNYYNSTSDNPISINYNNNETLSEIEFDIPNTVIINNVTIHDYNKTALFTPYVEIKTSQNYYNISEESNNGTYLLQLFIIPEYSGYYNINWTTVNNELLTLGMYSTAILESTEINATLISSTLPNFNISTGYMVAGVAKNFNITVNYTNMNIVSWNNTFTEDSDLVFGVTNGTEVNFTATSDLNWTTGLVSCGSGDFNGYSRVSNTEVEASCTFNNSELNEVWIQLNNTFGVYDTVYWNVTSVDGINILSYNSSGWNINQTFGNSTSYGVNIGSSIIYTVDTDLEISSVYNSCDNSTITFESFLTNGTQSQLICEFNNTGTNIVNMTVYDIYGGSGTQLWNITSYRLPNITSWNNSVTGNESLELTRLGGYPISYDVYTQYPVFDFELDCGTGTPGGSVENGSWYSTDCTYSNRGETYTTITAENELGMTDSVTWNVTVTEHMNITSWNTNITDFFVNEVSVAKNDRVIFYAVSNINITSYDSDCGSGSELYSTIYSPNGTLITCEMDTSGNTEVNITAYGIFGTYDTQIWNVTVNDPSNISSWSNTYTNDATNNFTVPENTQVTFNVTDLYANDYEWYLDEVAQEVDFNNWSRNFILEGFTNNITVITNNSYGSDSHQWNVTVINNVSYIAPVVSPEFAPLTNSSNSAGLQAGDQENVNWTDGFIQSFHEDNTANPVYVYETFDTSLNLDPSGLFDLFTNVWYETITPTSHYWTTELQSVNGTWVQISNASTQINENTTVGGYENYSISNLDTSTFRYANGTIKLRYVHPFNGNPNHNLHFDEIKLNLDTAINITSWSNDFTGDDDLSINVEIGETVTFNVTTDKDINSSISSCLNATSVTTFVGTTSVIKTCTFDEGGERYVNILTEDVTGEFKIKQWTITVIPLNITSWQNSYTEDSSTSLSLLGNNSVTFNATTNNSVDSWDYGCQSGSLSGVSSDSNNLEFTCAVTSESGTPAYITATNTNGINDTIQWNLSVTTVSLTDPTNLTYNRMNHTLEFNSGDSALSDYAYVYVDNTKLNEVHGLTSRSYQEVSLGSYLPVTDNEIQIKLVEYNTTLGQISTNYLNDTSTINYVSSYDRFGYSLESTLREDSNIDGLTTEDIDRLNTIGQQQTFNLRFASAGDSFIIRDEYTNEILYNYIATEPAEVIINYVQQTGRPNLGRYGINKVFIGLEDTSLIGSNDTYKNNETYRVIHSENDSYIMFNITEIDNDNNDKFSEGAAFDKDSYVAGEDINITWIGNITNIKLYAKAVNTSSSDLYLIQNITLDGSSERGKFNILNTDDVQTQTLYNLGLIQNGLWYVTSSNTDETFSSSAMAYVTVPYAYVPVEPVSGIASLGDLQNGFNLSMMALFLSSLILMFVTIWIVGTHFKNMEYDNGHKNTIVLLLIGLEAFVAMILGWIPFEVVLVIGILIVLSFVEKRTGGKNEGGLT